MSWKRFQMSKMSSGFSSFSCYAPIIFVIFHRALWKGAGFITCFYWAKKGVKHCWSVLIFVYHIQMTERGRFYVCLLVGWHHWEAISQALSPKTFNGNVASHCTHSFVTAACVWLFLSTINQILLHCLVNILIQSGGVIIQTGIVTTQETHLVE